MANQVEGGGGANAAAAARAAEEARRRAAEEAARRAAEAAARRAAEEAAKRQAQEAAERRQAKEQAKDKSEAVGTGRYAAYGAPAEAPPEPAAKPASVAKPERAEAVEPAKAEAEPKGFFEKIIAQPKAILDEVIANPKTVIDKIMAFVGLGAPAAPPAKEAPASRPMAAIEKAADTAGTLPETPALPAKIAAKMEAAKEQAADKLAAKQGRLEPPSAEARAENAKQPVAPEHEYLYNTLEPVQQQAFKELAPASRDSFNKVYEKVGGLWAEPTQFSTEASHGLRKMLQEHKLEVRDTTGQTLLGTLAKRADQPLQESVQQNNSVIGTLQSAIKQVAYPDRVYQGENTNTCASTALQGILANEDPAEYLRIATGLVFDGHVKLQGGADLKLDASKVGNSQDGDRSALSDALQTSFDTFAKQFPPQSDADFGGGRVGGGGRYGGGRAAGAGRFGGGKVGGKGRFGEGEVSATAEQVAKAAAQVAKAVGGTNGGQVDGGGLTQNQIEKLYENAAGQLAVNVTVDDDNRFSTLDGVAAALEGGQKVPVGVQGIDGEGNATHHMISVLEIRKDAEDPGKDQVVFTDPGTGQVAALPVNDFARILEAAIIPAQYADHMRWNVAPNEADPFGGGRTGTGPRMG